MPHYSAKTKFAFCRRLAKNWKDLADYFDIPRYRRDRFKSGEEGWEIRKWLEEQKRLGELPEALEFIRREDLRLILWPPPAPILSTSWQGSPFPGLLPFSEYYAPVFFGRDRHTEELIDKFKDPKIRFIAVMGASGSGKSSLVAAGLLPRLKQDAIPGSKDWVVLELTPSGPGNDPFLKLATKLEPLLKRQGWHAGNIDTRLRANGNLLELAEQALDPLNHVQLLLFIDQFEELFTLCAQEYRWPFTTMLAKAARTQRIRTVITLRSDFCTHCLNDENLVGLLKSGFYPLPLPGAAELYQMITAPAALAGLTFDDGLPFRILDDTGREPGALPLTAFILAELYRVQEQRGDKRLTLADYQRLGGLSGAIRKQADETVIHLHGAARAAMGSVFKELVEVDPERGVPIRKRAPLHRIYGSPGAKALIDTLADKRLLIKSVAENGETVVEVAHEALLTSWPSLKNWIEERFDDFRLLRQVKLEAAEWQRQGCPKDFLWRHERLAPVYAMRDRLQPSLSPLQAEFIRPENKRLLEELDNPATPHQRRVMIGDRLAEIGDPRPGIGLNRQGLPDFVWCPVPSGEVILEDNAGIFQVEPFYISKYPITWVQYRSFLEVSDGYRNKDWWKGLAERDKEPGKQYRKLDNHPAEKVSWYDAVAFCRWLSTRLGYEIWLPTEWQWQQAATGGIPVHEYPWGAEWHSAYANTIENGLSRTTAVGMYPPGISPVGAWDMSGNIWEWCLNAYDNPKSIDYSGVCRRVVRGGSWYSSQDLARTASRRGNLPDARLYGRGFRVAVYNYRPEILEPVS